MRTNIPAWHTPPSAWSECHHRVGEVLLQDISLRPFEMAANPRHGQLSRPEGGEDLGEIRHNHGLIPVDVRQARLPVVRVALSTKINARRMGFVFEWPGTHQKLGILTVHPLSDA